MNGYIKKQALMDYCSNQVTRTIGLNDIARFPIAEIYTKADMVAMLEDLKQDFIAEAYGIEIDCTDYVVNVADIDKVIQQKINELRVVKDGNE